jgi:hypothetical protein
MLGRLPSVSRVAQQRVSSLGARGLSLQQPASKSMRRTAPAVLDMLDLTQTPEESAPHPVLAAHAGLLWENNGDSWKLTSQPTIPQIPSKAVRASTGRLEVVFQGTKMWKDEMTGCWQIAEPEREPEERRRRILAAHGGLLWENRRSDGVWSLATNPTIPDMPSEAVRASSGRLETTFQGTKMYKDEALNCWRLA